MIIMLSLSESTNNINPANFEELCDLPTTFTEVIRGYVYVANLACYCPGLVFLRAPTWLSVWRYQMEETRGPPGSG